VKLHGNKGRIELLSVLTLIMLTALNWFRTGLKGEIFFILYLSCRDIKLFYYK